MNPQENKSASRPHYLDASVLVKLVLDEDYSDRVRGYINASERSWRVCTSFCYSEAFGALKLKYKRGEISEKAYIAGSRSLVRLARDNRIEVLAGDFLSHQAFAEAERMVTAYGIDFIDAFQLISSKDSWSHLASPSQPILVTADGPLAKAAKGEDLRFWYVRETREPTC
jgi:predicted nucleic acid-binding protein